MRRAAALLLLFLFLPITALADLQVHFLDVGQGDCTVVLCDGEAMVIDGGPRSASRYVYNYIRKTLKLGHLDYLVSTHPHIDHVYGVASILNAVQVDLLLSPVTKWDSRAFDNVLKYAAAQGTPLVVPEEGDTLQLGGATVMTTSGEELPENVRCFVEDCGYSSIWDEFCFHMRYVYGLPARPILNVCQLIVKSRYGYGFSEHSAKRQVKQTA